MSLTYLQYAFTNPVRNPAEIFLPKKGHQKSLQSINCKPPEGLLHLLITHIPVQIIHIERPFKKPV